VTEGSTDQWLADLYGPDPSAAPAQEIAASSAAAEPGASAGNSDTGDAPAQSHKKAAMVLGVGLVVAATAIAAALSRFGGPPPSSPPHRPASVAASAAPVTAPTPAAQDQAIPFTADANCPTGSTSAQALTDSTSDSAWLCVRGGVDGQVLHLDLGKTYVLTAVSVTPGWVAKTPGGKDEWLQHRVVSRLQYSFNDSDRTIVTQDTGNAHGPVTLPLTKIVASRVTVIVLQTSRPPSTPQPGGSAPAPPGGFIDSVLGAAGAPLPPEATTTNDPALPGEPGSDPVDATFAMSGLAFFGHPPG
jgi:hypothetical protein